MGAEKFDTGIIKIDDADEAFRTAVSQAQWDYGHAGYTGTIAEKEEYVMFTPPQGHSVDEVIDLLDRSWREAPPEWIPKSVIKAFDDKWGPAVAIQAENGWRFVGWASA